MSLKPTPITAIPEQTARIAHAAFPKSSLFMRMRDELGVFWQDEDFAHLFAHDGQPALCAWRLALVTLMQFAEQLSDRQAAEAVRSRIDWKYALGLELTDPGFHYSVLCEFRTRLINSNSEHLLLERLLATFRANGLLKARGKQRTDSTHVLGAIRILNRLELVAESLRAALNALATTAPDWVRQIALPEWFERHSYRIDEYRLPQEKATREAYIRTVGEDGFALLDALDAKTTAAKLRELSMVKTFQQIWNQHYLRDEGQVRWRTDDERPPGRERFDSPYEVEARYSSKRSTTWSGYKVHVTETCEPDEVHLITHVETQPAVIQDVSTTAPIHMALAAKELLPVEHLVDAGYVDAQLLVDSQEDYGIELIGPTRGEKGWQSQVAEAYSIERFQINWQAHRVTCPQGKVSSSWTPQTDRFGSQYIFVKFRTTDCRNCTVRELCTRAKSSPRGLGLHPQRQHEALQAARARLLTREGQQRYNLRAGIEGTLSQGVRSFGLRQARYRGLSKTRLQHLATAAAINVLRMVNWLEGIPQGKTRISRFAALKAAF